MKMFAWVKRLLDRMFRLEEINGDGLCPTYLYRWTLLRWGTLAVYLHKFVGDDWSLDLHDHPKRFWSIGLLGGYNEWTPGSNFCREWRAPWIRTFPAVHTHRLTGPSPDNPCWTLVITGKPVRAWGFWHFGQFVPWRKYVSSATAKGRKACP
jgi:hypothetical protein